MVKFNIKENEEPSVWVGVYDPRLNGAVIVQSHTKNIKEGDIIPIE